MADTMQYTVQAPDGTTGTVGDEEMQNHLMDKGHPVTGRSADGQTLSFQDPKGNPYQVDIADVLKDQGYKIIGQQPTNVNYDYVKPEWRAAVASSQDDDHAKAYLESRLAKVPNAVPSVVGKGEDWYYYAPDTGQWYGVTRNPNTRFDEADAASLAAKALPTLGATLGGVAGGTSGSIPGAALGAAGGGALGRAGQHAVMSAIDPTYGAMNPMAEEGISPEEGMALGGDAAMGAVGAGANQILKGGPLSYLARGGGKALQTVGDALQGASQWVQDTPWAKWLANETVNPASSVANAALPLSAPRDAAEMAMNVIRNRASQPGSSALMQSLAEEGEATAPSATQKFANWAKGAPTDTTVPSSPTVDLARNTGRVIASKLAPGSGMAEEELASQLGSNPEFAAQDPNVMAQARSTISSALQQQQAQAAGDAGAQVGQQMGKAVQTAGDLGDVMTAGAGKVLDAGLMASKYGGKAMSGVGSFMQGAGNIGQSTELPAAAQSAIHSKYGEDLDDYLKRKYLQSYP